MLINIDKYAAFEEYTHRRYVAEKLAEAEVAAANPDTKRLSHEEFWCALDPSRHILDKGRQSGEESDWTPVGEVRAHLKERYSG